MKIYIHGRNLDSIKKRLLERNFTVTDDPAAADLILTHGGDGSMLGAEQLWPGKLKFSLRDEETAPLCPAHQIEKQLDMLAAGTLKKNRLPKLEGSANGRKLTAINDIYLHNHVRVSALRYKVWINDELYAREVVGDGVGVSTVHGSTAYYRSITNSIFRVGLGLAFSNSTELVNHLVIPEDSTVKIEILRGPGDLVSDNAPDVISLAAGDTAEIKLSTDYAEFLGLDFFMCPVCRNLRHSLRNSTQYL